jgi:hypothetical protein
MPCECDPPVGPHCSVKPPSWTSRWWRRHVIMQDGPGRHPLGLFGNTGELRLEETSARDGGQIRGTFTLRVRTG